MHEIKLVMIRFKLNSVVEVLNDTEVGDAAITGCRLSITVFSELQVDKDQFPF